jgi:hypothetical protein
MNEERSIFVVTFSYIKDKTIKFFPIEIQATDMIRACVLAEKQVETDTEGRYRIIKIEEKQQTMVREAHLSAVQEQESRLNEFVTVGKKRGRPKKAVDISQ